MMQDFSFIKDWRKHQLNILQTMHPELEKKQIKKVLNDVIDERTVNPEALLHNNYTHTKLKITLLRVIDWYKDHSPITAGFGMFYKNQNQVINPASIMLTNFLKLRKTYKSQLALLREESYEYLTFDRLQLMEKINGNSFYGASGAPSSNFYNVYTATSVTATGQSLISTTEQAFEAFLSNNVLFSGIDDCFHFMEKIRKEKKEINGTFLPNVSVDMLVKHLSESFYEFKEEYNSLLFSYIIGLPQSLINRIYFKNNIYAFSNLPKIRNRLTTAVRKIKSFKNPSKIPDEGKDELEELWAYYKEFVLYNESPMGRIQRLKNDTRKTVVVVDTDSNMLNLNPWVEFMNHSVISVDYKISRRDPEELRFICINMMAYFITNMISEVLKKYTNNSNVPKEFSALINMKNEFLFTRLILSSKKKRYISSVRLKEGKEIYPEKVDIKGMDFIKSSTKEETKTYFTNLVKEEILYSDNVSLPNVLRKLEKFEGAIMDSLRKGEKNFLIPKSVKELEAYSDPYAQQGVRGVMVWNFVNPGSAIQLPEKVDIIKVKMTTEEELAPLEEVNKDAYDRLMKHVFKSGNKKLVDKGIQIVALPRNVEAIPDWILPFIDYDTIVNDNVSRFYSVLESLGIETIKASDKKYFTNILKV